MRGSTLIQSARGLLREALAASADPAAGAAVEAALERLEAPLRVAIAGKVKGGKSTLVNALVGEKLAPTDAGECTRIVTWYRQGTTYSVRAHSIGGEVVDVPFRRDGGAIEVLDFASLAAAEVDHLSVSWPSAALATLTLVDTPGLDSLSVDLGERTRAFLVPDEAVTPADAVVFLMRHVHSRDMRILEAFHDDGMARATPVNAIGVLSRADEVGGGRLDSMESARRVAERYRGDASLRRLCQTVIPVAGLLAEAGTTLTEREFRALQVFAGMPRAEADALLLSADRFGRSDPSDPLPAEERRHLIERLGLFGVRLAVALLRGGAVSTSPEMAAELVRRSGLVDLRAALESQFSARADVLKARSALNVLDSVFRAWPSPAFARLAQDLERIFASAHELVEIRLLNAVRLGTAGFAESEVAGVERLLGLEGGAATRRLDLPASAPPEEIRHRALSELGRWQQRAESPMSTRDAVDAARVLVRTCEGILAGT